MVSMDIYLNETTRHADVILPGPSPLEDFHYDVAFPQLSWRNHARGSEPIFKPEAGQHAEWQTILKLAAIIKGQGAQADVDALDDAEFEQDIARLDLPAAAVPAVMAATATYSGPQRALDVALRFGPYGDQFGKKPEGLNLAKVLQASAAGGIDLGALQPRIPEMLRTPSGKVELSPPSLLQDLKRAEADLQSAKPELVIIGRRDVRSNNSWMHNLPVLAKGPFRCTLLVSSQDASKHGVTEGSTVTLNNITQNENEQRSIQAVVQISADMMPGVVSLPHGWGHDLPNSKLRVAAERPGANLNALLDMKLRDPLSGNSVLGGVPVTMSLA